MAVSPRSRAGTRVVLQANPASRSLYGGGLPEDGTEGTVTPIAGPGGKMTYMPGPGGGLLYIKFDDGTFMGVSPHDLNKAGRMAAASSERVAYQYLVRRES